MHTRARLGAAVAAVALLAGTVGSAAAASAGTSPSTSPKTATVKAKTDGLASLAREYGVSVTALEAALVSAKGMLGSDTYQDSAVAAVIAKDLGLSDDSARALLAEVFGKTFPGGKNATHDADERTAHVLAGLLGVSDTRGLLVLHELQALDVSPKQDPDSAGFAAIASSLSLTPPALNQVLVELKQRLLSS